MEKTHAEAINYLYSLRNMGAKLGLERVERLLEELGSPQNDFRSILVGGTSGKGSTVTMLASILQETGYKTGRYTSPHLHSLTERIVIDGKEINENELVAMVVRIRNAIEKMKTQPEFEHPTFFEVITAIAFLYFAEKKVEIAVLEVGLGGRLDATNVVNPLCSIITNVSLEHQKILGDTVEKIANEKAGIIKNNGILITAAKEGALAVLETKCKKKNSRIIRIGKEIIATRSFVGIDGQKIRIKNSERMYELFVPFIGRYQIENTACAVGAICVLQNSGIAISDMAIINGLKNTRWPGRMEIIQKKPLIILDGAKDANAMERLVETISNDIDYGKLIVVMSICSDKNIKKMMEEIVKITDHIIITKHKVMDRAIDPKIIAKEVHSIPYEIIEDVRQATKKAIEIANDDDLVLVTGSLFAVAEAREIWYGKNITMGLDLNEIPKK